MKIHHLGYLVKNLERALEKFQELGYRTLSAPCFDEGRDADILFLEKDGYCVELVSPRSAESVVGRLIRSYKNTPYHICYEAENFERELSEWEGKGFTRMGDPAPAPALQGRRVCFLMSARIGMIEILEEVNRQ